MNFNKYFLLDNDTAKEYLISKEIFPKNSNLTCKEIGDGNINYVFIVKDEQTEKSVVIKQADILLRSSGRPLDNERITKEVYSLKIFQVIDKEKFPQIYLYDHIMKLYVMEDISSYKNMRYSLIERTIIPNFSESISEYLSKAIFYTSDFYLELQKKKKLVKFFINPELCDISEDLVFTEPYNDYKKQNNYEKENKKVIEEKLYKDEIVLQQASKLKYKFINAPQCLLHGDLHSGSIFVKEDKLKIIDSEFSFFGPAGYDIGNVLAHLVFPIVLDNIENNKITEFSKYYLKQIEEIYEKINKKLIAVFENSKNFFNKNFIKDYIQSIMLDSCGYMATEIIRRAIGDSRVKEITKLPQDKRIIMERKLINIGCDILKNSDHITNGIKLKKYVEKHLN